MKKLLLASLLIAAAALASPKPWLGLALKLRSDTTGGKFLYVAHAPQDAPGYRSGVREGDLITAIDGKPIRFRDDADIVDFSARLTPGNTLKLRIVRSGKPREIRVRVGTLPAELEPLYDESVRRARASRKSS